MRKISVSEEFFIRCMRCRKEFDLIQQKRRTSKYDKIKCPHCKNVVEK